jgi:hypothetical protein
MRPRNQGHTIEPYRIDARLDSLLSDLRTLGYDPETTNDDLRQAINHLEYAMIHLRRYVVEMGCTTGETFFGD